MRAVCRQVKPDDSWHPHNRKIYDEHVHLDEVLLDIGRSYIVYGVYFWDGLPWYLVCEEPTAMYPVPNCGLLFDLVDPTIPSDWQLRTENSRAAAVLLPKRWAEDPMLMERLIDGDPEAETLFRALREDYDRRF